MNDREITKKLLIIILTVVMWVYVVWRALYTIPDGWAMTVGTMFFAVELILIIQHTIFLILLFNPSKYEVPSMPEILPSVDVFITTYNEPVEVLRRTVLACRNLEYPQDKLTIWLCDDGSRREMKVLADEVGIQYLSRQNNEHAKAGNLNNALQHSFGEIVVTIDADMVVQPHFLKHTIGFFEDEKMGFVQTPQSFFNEDIFQYNSQKSRTIPNEQDLFMQNVQAGRDKYNASIYVGSNALFRRKALESVGGFATGTITEDMATGMLVQAKGYQTVAYSEVLAQGLAPESLDDLMKQRVRWARGTVQTMRKWNPLTMKGLTLMQRSLYLSSWMYWFFGLFRSVLLLAPIIYLLFGVPFLHATIPSILIFWLPYFALSFITFKYVTGKKGTIFWSNIYETAMMFTVARAVLIELILKKPVNFSVTRKGLQINTGKWNGRFLAPILFLFAFTLLALINGFWELYSSSNESLLTGHVINLFWATYNLLILYYAIKVGYERPRLRKTERFEKKLPVQIFHSDEPDLILSASTLNVSETGCSVWFKDSDTLQSAVTLVIAGKQQHIIAAELVRQETKEDGSCQAHFKFTEMTLDALRHWVQEVYSIDQNIHEPARKRLLYQAAVRLYSAIVKV